MKKFSLVILCGALVLIRCASAIDSERSAAWSGVDGAVGIYSGVALSGAKNGPLSGAAFVANSFVVFRCGDAVCTNPATTKLAIKHTGISNYAFVGSETTPLLIFTERGRDGLRKILCGEASCSTMSEQPPSAFRYGTWRLADGDVPQLVAEVKSLIGESSDLVRFECSPRRCDEGVAQVIARSTRVGHLGAAWGDNQLWVANADLNSITLHVYRCDDTACKQVTVPSLGPGVAVSVDAAFAEGTAWFVVTQRDAERNTLRLVACRDDDCRSMHDPIEEGSIEHARVAAGSFGPIVAYTDMQDGRLRLAQCSEAGCRTNVVLQQGTPYAVTLHNDSVVIAYSDAGDPRLAVCKDDECIAREIVWSSLSSDAAAAHRRK